MRGNIDHLDGLDRPGLGLRGGLFVALAAHLIGVPPVIIADCRLPIDDYWVHSSNRQSTFGNHQLNAGLFDLHLLEGERVADDIPGQPLKIFPLIRLNPPASIHIKPGVFPAL